MTMSRLAQSTLFLLVAAIGLLSSSARALAFQSKGGVTVRTIEALALFRDGAEAIPGCEEAWGSVAGNASLKFETAAWLGLHDSSLQSLHTYRDLSKQHVKTLLYAEKRRLSSSTSAMPAEDAFGVCASRRMLLTQLSYGGAACDCTLGLGDKEYCKVRDHVLTTLFCHSTSIKKLKTGDICPTLLKPDLGIQLSQMCSGWVAGVVSALDFNLYNLVKGDSMPAEIEEKILRQESRAYYLSWKALERMDRWGLAHLRCKEEDKNNVLEDFEILPSYKPILYVYNEDPEHGRVPVAVLSRRGKETFLLSVRDALTNFEGFLTDNSAVQMKHASKLYPLKGAMHEGYAAMAQAIYPTIQAKLRDVFAEVTTFTFPTIINIGRGNFGSGVATVLAAYLSVDFATIHEHTTVSLNAILFGGAPVGDEMFSHYVSQKVNIRNVNSDMESVSALPCATSKGCGYSGSKNFYGLVGERSIFHPLPGRVRMDIENLKHDVWRSEAVKFESLAVKYCAPICWLSTKFCPDEPDSKCDVESCGLFHSAHDWD